MKEVHFSLISQCCHDLASSFSNHLIMVDRTTYRSLNVYVYVMTCEHRFPLCVKPPDKNQEILQDLRYTFLKSSWHTDAKKIPEKLIYWRHLACFFSKNQIFLKKFFWLKVIRKVQKWFLAKKIFFEKKIFFWKNT